MEKELIELNKQIAEFHGWTHYPTTMNKGKGYWSFPAWNKAVFTEDNFQYHSSWDWLMPVVGKIGSISEEIDGNYTEEDDYHNVFYGLVFHSLYIWADIKTVWLAVIEFIKWYNATQTEYENQKSKV